MRYWRWMGSTSTVRAPRILPSPWGYRGSLDIQGSRQLPALGADRRGGSLEFAQYDTKLDKTGMDKKLDKTGMDKKLDKTGMDKKLDKTGMDKKLDKTGMDNPATAIRQTPPAGGEVVSAPPAPASAIRGSSGVTIINAPAEGAAIESHTGPTIMRAPGATQE